MAADCHLGPPLPGLSSLRAGCPPLPAELHPNFPLCAGQASAAPRLHAWRCSRHSLSRCRSPAFVREGSGPPPSPTWRQRTYRPSSTRSVVHRQSSASAQSADPCNCPSPSACSYPSSSACNSPSPSACRRTGSGPCGGAWRRSIARLRGPTGWASPAGSPWARGMSASCAWQRGRPLC